MMTPILLYLLSGCVALGAALWIVGDLAEGKRIVLTWRMGLLVLAWPAALLWLIVAAAWDIAGALRRRIWQ